MKDSTRSLEKKLIDERDCLALFYDTSELEWCTKLRSNAEVIRNEIENFLSTHPNPARVREIDEYQREIDTGDIPWSMVPLRIITQSNASFYYPDEFKLTLGLLPHDNITAYFSILPPNKKIPIHEGIYQGILRYHLCVVEVGPNCRMRFPCEVHKPTYLPKNAKLRPPCQATEVHFVSRESFRDEMACKLNCDFSVDTCWEFAQDVLFDDTHLHYVYNDTQKDRIVLIIDVPKPLLDRNNDEANRTILAKVVENHHQKLA